MARDDEKRTGDWPPPHGDEAELFREFDRDLRRIVQSRVRTSPDIVDDACAFAWSAFMRYQPDRNRAWRAWMVVTAEREAWRSHRLESGRDPLTTLGSGDGEVVAEPLDPHDVYAERQALRDALDLLAQVPESRRSAKALQVTGFTYAEIAEALGVSYSRVNHYIDDANAIIREIYARTAPEHVPRTPRAVRLRQLEHAPPDWLLRAIGPIPVSVKAPEVKLLWRRAALALDDYRRRAGRQLEVEALGPRPTDPAGSRAYDVAAAAVARVGRARAAWRENSRGSGGVNRRLPPSIDR
jgi:RNA polymerase sigma factor (sigma-70 family)